MNKYRSPVKRSRSPAKRSRSPVKRSRSPAKRSRTSHRFLEKRSHELSECRGRSRKSCMSNPNCSYRKRIGCVKGRKAFKKRSLKYYGPSLE